MKNIKGLTRKETIELLQNYILFSLREDRPISSELYICNFCRIYGRAFTEDTIVFISYWYKKIYGLDAINNPIYGMFGNPIYDNNFRIAFVTLILHELTRDNA